MFTLTKKLKFTFIGMAYGMMISLPVAADDIEIYKSSGSTTPTSQANLLFVLDTSGSMSNTVTTREIYNPAADYSGGNACYSNSRVYTLRGNRNFTNTNNAGRSNAEFYCTNNWQFNNKVRQFNRTAVVCDAASSLETTGFYTGRISQYRNGNWDDSLAQNDLTAFVECEGDSGEHGQTTGNAAKWASKSGAPWTTNSGNEINWGTKGISKTISTGHYLNYIINGPSTTLQRIDIMKNVMNDVIASVTDVNIGLMRFSRNSDGGMVVVPVGDIGPTDNNPAVGTQRRKIMDELAIMTPSGGTPLSEAFYEAVMYFKGGTVDYGVGSTNEAGAYPSVAASQSGGQYISPITHECQKNYVVLLTDGDPYNDSLGSGRRSKIGSDVTGCQSNNNCLDEIAHSIGTNDQNSILSDDQVISTYTIGFENANTLLQQTADASKAATGIGERFFADNAATLTDSLNTIIVNVFDTDTSFSSPAVSVNAFNRSTHLNDLYFTLFKPVIGPHWPGNIKKYKLDFLPDVDDIDGDGNLSENQPFIVDSNGKKAIDRSTGFFDVGVQSFWSSSADEDNVEFGGAAREFENNGARNVYTFTDTYTNNSGVFVPDTSDLTASSNAVDKTNANITDVMLAVDGLPPVTGMAPTPRIETLLDWAAGLDVFNLYGANGTTTDQRLEMGDPLHSQPALVQYGLIAAGAGAGEPDLVAYVATNDGYLHATNTFTGAEIFSFIPQELLPNLNTLMEDDSGNKTYGLDGDVVAWINDANGDGTVSGAGEHVYLYITMRRGGNNIYSLDVTDRTSPALRWVIKGGVGDYAEMGQTWSTVNVEKVKDGSAEKVVLIFGGGYDTNQDGVTVTTADTVGRAVYIADADTGALMWSAGPGGDLDLSKMEYSIPARIKPLDMSGDGFIDRLYAADMGGQIFRFDINNNNGNSLAGSVTGGRIADLSSSGSAHARRFYYPPDVALAADKGKPPYLALALTSGYRAHPNDKDIHDRIYVIKDTNIYNIPGSYTTIREPQLYDATLNLAGGDGDDLQNEAAQTALSDNDGWFIKLDDGTNSNTWIGEKGLSEVLILEGVVIATTFTPNSVAAATTSCDPQSGIGKVFFVDLFDASPAFPSNNDSRSERSKVLSKGGIPPTPNVIITKGGDPTLCIGTECEQAQLSKGVRKTHWYEVEK